jgi:hypothetical protein
MKVAKVPLDDPAEKNGLIRYSLRPRGIGHRPEDAPIAASIPPASGRFPYVHSDRAPVLRGNKDYVYERIVECGVDGIVNPAEVKDQYLLPREIQRQFEQQLRQVDRLDSVVVDAEANQLPDGVFVLGQERQSMGIQVNSDQPMGVMRQSVETRRKNRSSGRIAMSSRQSIRPSLDDSFDAILGRRGDVLESKSRPTFGIARKVMPTSAPNTHLAHPRMFSRPKQGLQSTTVRSHDPKDAPRGFGVNHGGVISNSRAETPLTFLRTGNYGPALGQVRKPDAVSRRKNIRPVPTSVV